MSIDDEYSGLLEDDFDFDGERDEQPNDKNI